jgi:hypothetical protein
MTLEGQAGCYGLDVASGRNYLVVLARQPTFRVGLHHHSTEELHIILHTWHHTRPSSMPPIALARVDSKRYKLRRKHQLEVAALASESNE